MFTEAQIQYIEDVLGASVSTFAQARESLLSPNPTIELMVLTTALSEDEGILFKKILSSVKLGEYKHVELEIVEPGHTPEGLLPKHVIAFTDNGRGRAVHDDVVWWCLPPLAKMLGATAEVAASKKEAWNLLQQFVRARGGK